jgi:hypothetical protein
MVRNPPNCDVHARSQQCPLYVDSARSRWEAAYAAEDEARLVALDEFRKRLALSQRVWHEAVTDLVHARPWWRPLRWCRRSNAGAPSILTFTFQRPEPLTRPRIPMPVNI